LDDSSPVGQASHYALDEPGSRGQPVRSSYDEGTVTQALSQGEGEFVPPEFASEAPKKSKRRQTAHLKLVPQTKELREKLAAKAAEVASKLDKSRPLSKDEMEKIVRRTLEESGQPEGYVGWMMVVLASEFWKDQVAAVPPSRRLFLLPHCLKHAEGCPAESEKGDTQMCRAGPKRTGRQGHRCHRAASV
jgi:hypothetical protein